MFYRNKKSIIWDYYEETGQFGKRRCNLCKTIISGTNTSNCHKHLKAMHASVLLSARDDSEFESDTVTSTTENENESVDDNRIPNLNKTLRSRSTRKSSNVSLNNADGNNVDAEGSVMGMKPSSSAAESERERNETETLTNNDKQYPPISSASKAIVKKKSTILNYYTRRRNKKAPYKKSGERWRILNFFLLKMIVSDFQPFSIVEDKGFREFVQELDPRYELPSRKHVSTSLLTQNYNACMKKLKNQLSNIK